MAGIVAATAIGVGGSLLGGYLAGEGAKDAANTSADASRYAADLSYDQYQQDRQDLSPYRDVATGTRNGYDSVNNQMDAIVNEFRVSERDAIAQHMPNATDEDIRNALLSGDMGQGWNSRWSQQMLEMKGLQGQLESYGDPANLTDGALNTLADYGRSQVAPGDYIPNSNIPEYQRSDIGNMPNVQGNLPTFDVNGEVTDFNVNGNIPDFNVGGDVSSFNYGDNAPQYNVDRSQTAFNVRGDIPEFDSTQFDIYKDPSYEWRKNEMLRGIDRTAGATGKITSGNRLEEIMSRTGDMASQEYGAARDRMVQDYDIGRQNEQSNYGRDLTAYDANRNINQEGYNRDNYAYDQNVSRENNLYGRSVGEYGMNRGVEDVNYNRGLTSYDASRANEATQYGRDTSAYDYQRTNEDTTYQRDLTGYDANRSNALTQYGFDTDAYNRAYGRDTDQYGRDLTAYNADTSRENALYGRGVDEYGRAYGQEGDYLNRLASLSQVGQTAVNTGINAGSNYTRSAGNAIQNAGNAQAAGIVGQTNAYTNTIADLSQLGGYYLNQNQTPYADNWVSDDPSVWG